MDRRQGQDRIASDLYVETQLAPTLSHGDVVILDCQHKTAADLMRGCRAQKNIQPCDFCSMELARHVIR